MMSRRTIIWFVALLFFTCAVEYADYVNERPCWNYRRAHRFFRSAETPNKLFAGDSEVSFNPCEMWYEMPIWVKVAVLGWIVAAIGFCASLMQDVWRFTRRRALSKSRFHKGDV